MEETKNMELNLPVEDDFYNVEHFNQNFRTLDTKAALASDLGNRAELTTVNKENVVAAVNELNLEVDKAKKSVGNGKSLLAAAITRKKVPTAADDSFGTMAGNVDAIRLGSGNATADKVLEGASFTNSSGAEQAGTMPNRGCSQPASMVEVSMDRNKLYSWMPYGYYPREQERADPHIEATVAEVASALSITADNIKHGTSICGIGGNFTADANIVADAVLPGYRGYAKGAGVDGRMELYSPTYADQREAEAAMYGKLTNDGIQRLYYRIDSARSKYNNNAVVIHYPVDKLGVTSDKILEGQSICGVNGAIPNRGLLSEDPYTYVNGTDLRLRIPCGAYLCKLQETADGYGLTDVHASLAKVASALGITADKIVAGQEVCGVAGTGQMRVVSIANGEVLTTATNSANEKTKTYNISAYAGYQNFTADNFNVDIFTAGNNNTTDQFVQGMSSAISNSYDASTGIFTVALKDKFTQYTSTIKYNLKLYYVG